MNELTLDKIKGILKDITFPANDKELHAFRGCKNHGIVDILHHCGDPTCTSCNHFSTEFDKAMKDELRKSIKF